MRKTIAKQLILSMGIWYFLIGAAGGPLTFTQVGPFATQTACQNYQAGVANLFGINTQVMTACFNTTATK